MPHKQIDSIAGQLTSLVNLVTLHCSLTLTPAFFKLLMLNSETRFENVGRTLGSISINVMLTWGTACGKYFIASSRIKSESWNHRSWRKSWSLHLKSPHVRQRRLSNIQIVLVCSWLTSAAVSTPVGPPPTITKCNSFRFISSDILGNEARSRLSRIFLWIVRAFSTSWVAIVSANQDDNYALLLNIFLKLKHRLQTKSAYL